MMSSVSRADTTIKSPCFIGPVNEHLVISRQPGMKSELGKNPENRFPKLFRHRAKPKLGIRVPLGIDLILVDKGAPIGVHQSPQAGNLIRTSLPNPRRNIQSIPQLVTRFQTSDLLQELDQFHAGDNDVAAKSPPFRNLETSQAEQTLNSTL